MSRFSLFISSMLACCLLGCEGPHLGGRLHSKIPGIVIESPPGTFVFHNLQVRLHRKERVTTSEIVKVDISQRKQGEESKSVVFFGPKPGATIDGWLVGDPDFHIDRSGGFVSVADDVYNAINIVIRLLTPWISAQATGSECAIEVVDLYTERVYFREGTEIVVTCLKGDKRHLSWTQDKTYLDVTMPSGNCEFNGPYVVDSTSPPAVKAFLDRLDKIEAAAP
ncbi:MAG: hypothetical protein HY287_16760 [Planctomycetes bacterium]|nr:hypothetical protein [Planctomycetota bacterium]